MRGAPLPSTDQGAVPFKAEIISLLQGGKKIAAIKFYREKTGVGLKEAKDFIEALAADRRIAVPSRSGCLGIALVVVAVVLMIVARSFAAEDRRPLEYRTIALNGDKGGTLAVVDGQPRLVNSPSAWNEWTLRQTDKGWTIQGRLSKKQNEPRYLSVDGEGKVTLVAELGDGAYWKLTRKGTGHSFDATLQASGGKCDGWYLGFSDKQEQIEKGKSKYKSYRPQLSEKPGSRTNLHIFIDGP
jgi:hypothetical protein